MAAPPPPSHRKEFEIAVLCALPSEAEAVERLFDHTWKNWKVTKASGDTNTYSTGMIGGHNIVLVFCPGMGKSNAASAASSCRFSFPNIKLALVVGICGGVPMNKSNKWFKEILLGDIIISDGLVQYDLGRQFPDKFSRKNSQNENLGRQNQEIRSHLNKLKGKVGRERLTENTAIHLKSLLQDSRLDAKYPGSKNDKLFSPTYRHKHYNSSCVFCSNCRTKLDKVCDIALSSSCDELGCDENRLVERNRLALRKIEELTENKSGTKAELEELPKPEIHFGTFASGDTVMKSGEYRDEIAASENVIGFEMEGAGVWDTFEGRVIVIKAVCDYADSHKDKSWQDYATIAAAACMKAFLQEWIVADKSTPQAQFGQIKRNGEILNKIESPLAGSTSGNHHQWFHEPGCLPGTRTELLQEVMTWSENPNTPSIFWLNGMTGTGKSTIARTITQRLAGQKRLGAGFFFSKGDAELENTAKFFIALAEQLGQRVPAIRLHARRAIADKFNFSMQSITEQWKNLIFQPLLDLDSSLFQAQPQIFIVVMDALDEYGNKEDIKLILQLLSEAKTLNAICLKIFVTSRPAHLGFCDIPDLDRHDCVLQNISWSSVQNDLSVYLRHELGSLRKESIGVDLWPSDQAIEILCHESDWSFIHASTACRFIGDPYRPQIEGLELFKEDFSVRQSLIPNLDHIYRRVLQLSITPADGSRQEKNSRRGEIGHILETLLTLFAPVSASTLSGLLGVPLETITQWLRPLQAVLSIPENHDFPIRLLHHSFREYLLDNQMSADLMFWINEKRVHAFLARRCLLLMSSSLKKDLCNLKLRGFLTQKVTEVEKSIPLHVQYACCHWIDHLNRSGIDVQDGGEVHNFLKKHFLHWLEALSLMGSLSASLLRLLESINLSHNSTQLHRIVEDAKKFIRFNGSVIEKAPLQTYDSALLFTSPSSTIRQLFSEQVPIGIHPVRAADEDWDPFPTLGSRTAMIMCLVFSHDKELLASGSSDGTICLWDTKTGEPQEMFQKHSSCVNSVAFSPIGTQLASAHSDSTVGLWDTETGTLQDLLEGHLEKVNSTTFSPKGQLLASTSDDRTVRIWDSETGDFLRLFDGYRAAVKSVVFAPDGQSLASLSADSIVRIYTIAGHLQQTLNLESGVINALAFSPDCGQLATASRCRTVRIWNTQTGILQKTFELNTAGVWTVMSSNGRRWSDGNSHRAWSSPKRSPTSSHPWQRQKSTRSSSGFAYYPAPVQHHSDPAYNTAHSWRPASRAGDYQPYKIAAQFGPRETKQYRPALPLSYPYFPRSSAKETTLNQPNWRQPRRPQITPSILKYLREEFDGHIDIHKLSFGDDGVTLITDIGVINLDMPASGAATTPWSTYSLDTEGAWITHKGERVILLGSELKPICQEFGEDIIALGSASGRVTILRVDPDVNDVYELPT